MNSSDQSRWLVSRDTLAMACASGYLFFAQTPPGFAQTASSMSDAAPGETLAHSVRTRSRVQIHLRTGNRQNGAGRKKGALADNITAISAAKDTSGGHLRLQTATGTQRTLHSLGFNAKPPTMPELPAGTYEAGHGLSFQLNYTSESAGNLTGGIRRGAAYADQILFGANADLDQIFHVPGATVHFVGTQRDGRSVAADAIGNTLAPQEIYDGSENTRLTILTYEQKLLDDKLSVEVGRLPAQGAFLVSPLYCNFQDLGICGSPEIIFSDTNFTFFPTSTWGGHTKLFLDNAVFVHAGLFEAQPSVVSPADHGLNFGLSGATGFFAPVELGYSTTSAQDPYPRNYSVGAIIDRSSYPDPFIDVAGGQAAFSNLAPQTRFGRSLIYERFDQTLYKSDPTTLQVFGAATEGTGGRQVQNYQLELGTVLTGPFENRPYDTIGLAVTDQRFSSLGLGDVLAVRASRGLNIANVARHETLVELNYGLQVRPGVRIMPNLQYIFHPDSINEPFRTKPIADAFVIGGKISVDLFTLAGLARGTGSY